MRWIGLTIFLSLFIIVAGGINYYLYRRMVSLLEIESQVLLWVLRAAFLLLMISYPTARIMVRQHINIFSAIWFWVSSIWMGIALYWFFLNLVAHAFMTGARIWGIYSLRENPGLGPTVFVVVLIFTLIVCGFAFWRARSKAFITELEIPVKTLPRDLDGFTIVQISDIHLGIVMGARYARRMVEQVNSLNPDLLVITGDLIDENPEELDNIFTELKGLHARYGAFAVTGNHEFYNKARRIINLSARAGVRYLQNEKVLIADLVYLYGIDDPTVRHVGGNSVPFEEVIGPEARTAPAILLYHQPSQFRKAAGLGIDLMLSGHTHNGQLWPIVYIVRLFFPRVHGHYMHEDSHLYVSRGIGAWGPPMRFGSPPEIVKIRLRSAQ